jgi:hypothetical protein
MTGQVDVSQYTPEQRARYDEAMARSDREMAAAKQRNLEWQQKVSDDSVLYGPALPDYDKFNAVLDQPDTASMIRESLRLNKQQFSEAVTETVQNFGRTKVDPAAQAAELAARTAARAPYRAPVVPHVVITRVATRGKSQLQELAAHLQQSGLASRPDLVHGIYRVPDRINHHITPHSEKGRVVEWAVVHHPGSLEPTAEPIESAAFPRHAQLIARRVGEPSVLDEEVAGLYCLLAGVAPEWCLGFARVPEFRHEGTHEGAASYYVVDVNGISVLHRPAPQAAQARRRFEVDAPLADALPALCHEVLDWHAIRERIQLDRRSPAAAPSPLPHLPASPEELLVAYLEVVGVQPGDSYGAQITITESRAIENAGSLADPLGPELWCADGKPRRRLHCAEHVVLTYRDRPEYAAGRERWKAYQHEVLSARLDHLSPKRPPLRAPAGPTAFDRAVGVINAVADPLLALDSLLDGRGSEPQPFPYCWPPVG